MSEEVQSFPGAFCESCNKWRKPSMLMPDGSCPRCRTVIDEEAGAAVTETDEAVDAGTDAVADAVAESVKVPWHFWVMVAATVLYLGWRVVHGIAALF